MPNRTTCSLIGSLATAALFAQVQAPTAFKIASIRPNTADDHVVTINVGHGGRFAARGYTLVLRMQRAYGVMDWNVAGGPGWIRTDRYDLEAQAMVVGNLTERQLRPMLQKLLAERFRLRLHTALKEMDGYALVVGKGGPKLKVSADGEEHLDTFRMSQTGLSGQGITMADLARYVGGKLGLVAVDQTGLKGVYDFKAQWTADRSPSPSPAFAALQAHLGFNLNAQTTSIQMLVIDSVHG